VPLLGTGGSPPPAVKCNVIHSLKMTIALLFV